MAAEIERMGKLDEISAAIGGLRASIAAIQETLREQSQCQKDTRKILDVLDDRLRDVENKLDPLMALHPIVSDLQASRSRLMGALTMLVVLASFFAWLIEVGLRYVISIWRT